MSVTQELEGLAAMVTVRRVLQCIEVSSYARVCINNLNILTHRFLAQIRRAQRQSASLSIPLLETVQQRYRCQVGAQRSEVS